jgi:hypothetical protein
LLARVDNFQIHLSKTKTQGFVFLSGDTLTKYINQRRIEGCNLMRRYPLERFTFVFDNKNKDAKVGFQFWSAPLGYSDEKFVATRPDYKLVDLKKPVELSTSMFDDEFCPRHFNLEWYARFLNANPKFTGRVVFDVKSRKVFLNRVRLRRIALSKLGVATKRITYIRHRFGGEQDEQFWMIR